MVTCMTSDHYISKPITLFRYMKMLKVIKHYFKEPAYLPDCTTLLNHFNFIITMGQEISISW